MLIHCTFLLVKSTCVGYIGVCSCEGKHEHGYNLNFALLIRYCLGGREPHGYAFERGSMANGKKKFSCGRVNNVGVDFFHFDYRAIEGNNFAEK